MTLFFWILGTIGTAELAAGHVLSNLLLFWMLLTNGFGLAAASLVGQALGAGAVDEARAWAWLVVRLAMVCVGLLALPAVLIPDAFLGLFLRDPITLDLARLPLQLTAATMALEVIGMVLMSAHYGAGHSRRVMVISWPAVVFFPAPGVRAQRGVWPGAAGDLESEYRLSFDPVCGVRVELADRELVPGADLKNLGLSI